MKLSIFILVGLVLPFIAGLAIAAMGISALLLFLTFTAWLDGQLGEKARNVFMYITALCLFSFSVYGVWLVGVEVLSRLWFR